MSSRVHFLLLVLVACGDGSGPVLRDAEADGEIGDSETRREAGPNDARIDSILAHKGDQRTGAALYSLSCSNCHDANGEAVPGKGVRVRDAVERRGERYVLDRLISGFGTESDAMFMPNFASLADQNLADLLLYLETGFVADAGVEQ